VIRWCIALDEASRRERLASEWSSTSATSAKYADGAFLTPRALLLFNGIAEKPVLLAREWSAFLDKF
jgi:hypothetical protein